LPALALILAPPPGTRPGQRYFRLRYASPMADRRTLAPSRRRCGARCRGRSRRSPLVRSRPAAKTRRVGRLLSAELQTRRRQSSSVRLIGGMRKAREGLARIAEIRAMSKPSPHFRDLPRAAQRGFFFMELQPPSSPSNLPPPPSRHATPARTRTRAAGVSPNSALK
jgi:hypothetical protein